MALSTERRKFIAAIANDEWTTQKEMDEEEFQRQEEIWDKRADDFLQNTEKPEELHAFVLMYNWDKRTDALDQLLDNPFCDLNTARLVFWLNEPDWHQERYSTREEAAEEYVEEQWDLLQLILKNVGSGKYKKAEVPEDYKNEIKKAVKNPKWEIPAAFYGEQ